MLRAIIFDFDGVLVDSEPLHFRAFAAIAPKMGTSIDYDEYLQTFIGFDDRDAVRELCRKSGRTMDEAALAQFRRLKQQTFDELVGEGVPMIPGARDLVEASSQAMPVAIASGATRRDIELVLGPLGLRDRFRTIVSADDVARSKPDPQTYALAVQRLAEWAGPLQPEECLAIEDTSAGLSSARGAGLRTLGLATTGNAAALHAAERVMPNLDGVTLDALRQWYA
jgi:beta-phosphoglucomutase